MIGKITLFIITLIMLITLLIDFMSVVNNNTIESHLYGYIETYAEKISMEGVISTLDYTRIKNHLQSTGDFEIDIKYKRRIGKDLYDISLDKEKIIDRPFQKGDIVNIVISKHNKLLFNMAAYVMVNMNKNYMGYEVIRSINDLTVPIFVRNIGQTEYIEYDDVYNPVYGDDEIESEFNIGYIFEYSKYIKREEYNGQELISISYTET